MYTISDTITTELKLELANQHCSGERDIDRLVLLIDKLVITVQRETLNDVLQRAKGHGLME